MILFPCQVSTDQASPTLPQPPIYQAHQAAGSVAHPFDTQNKSKENNDYNATQTGHHNATHRRITTHTGGGAMGFLKNINL